MKHLSTFSIIGLGLSFANTGCNQQAALDATANSANTASVTNAMIQAPSSTLRKDESVNEVFSVDASTLQSDGVTSGLPLQIVNYTVKDSKGQLVPTNAITKTLDNSGSIKSLSINFSSIGVDIYQVQLTVQNSIGAQSQVNYRIYQNDTSSGGAAAKVWNIINDGKQSLLVASNAIDAGFGDKSDTAISIVDGKDAKGGKVDVTKQCSARFDKTKSPYELVCNASVASGTIALTNGKTSVNVSFTAGLPAPWTVKGFTLLLSDAVTAGAAAKSATYMGIADIADSDGNALDPNKDCTEVPDKSGNVTEIDCDVSVVSGTVAFADSGRKFTDSFTIAAPAANKMLAKMDAAPAANKRFVNGNAPVVPAPVLAADMAPAVNAVKALAK